MAAAPESPRILGLCSGIGGLELGACAAWPGARVVACVERDPYAASVLLARMEDEAMEPAPIWCGDLADFDAAALRGRVDAVVAGIPCQPWSLAGQQQGRDDARELGPQLVRVVRDARPGVVVVENVPGFQGALPLLAQELAALGFDAEWGRLRASDVGAPHRRERVFVLAAHPERIELREQPRRCGGTDGACAARARVDGACGCPSRSPGWAAQPGVERSGDGIPARVDRLRCLGNAVVPQQGAAAIAELSRRVGLDWT